MKEMYAGVVSACNEGGACVRLCVCVGGEGNRGEESL